MKGNQSGKDKKPEIIEMGETIKVGRVKKRKKMKYERQSKWEG